MKTKSWQDFLDSLSTKGGKIFVAFTMVCLISVFFLHVVHHSADAATVEAFKSILTGFVGALLAMLSGNSSRQQMQDRIDTTRIMPVVMPPPESAPAPSPSTLEAPARIPAVAVPGRPFETK